MMSKEVMHGKICLVTGGTSGIGKETARQLAQQGAHVVIVGRSEEKAKKTVEWIKEQTRSEQIEFLIADLSSQREVRTLAKTFKRSFDRLDVLINNAGGIFSVRELTADGFERTWALNHLAYFTLTIELLDILKSSPPSRIINVSSGLHAKGKIDLDDLQFENGYEMMAAYCRSKLANVLFTYALARRLDGTSVTSNCLHPGVIATRFGHNNKGPFKWMMIAVRPFLLSAAKGAATSVYLATSPDINSVTGKFFVNCHAKDSSKQSYDLTLQDRLWEASMEEIAVTSADLAT